MVTAAARVFATPPRARGDASGATRRLAPRRGGRPDVPNRGRVGGRPADATAWRPVTLGDVDELGVARSPESDTGEPSACVTFDSPRALMERFALVLERTPLESDVPARDARLMRHALSRHPDARRKVGGGVSRIRVRAHDTKGYRYFELTRVDGTSDDVSFRKCVAALFPGFGSGAHREGAGAAPRRESGGRGAVGAARGAALLTSLILEQTSVRGVLRALRLEGDDEVLAALREKKTNAKEMMTRDAEDENVRRSESSREDDVQVRALAATVASGPSGCSGRATLRASLDRVHVATALVKIARLTRDGGGDAGAEALARGEHRRENRLASSETYAALVETARAMCADGRFDARATANAIHAVAKTFTAEPSRRIEKAANRKSGSFDDAFAPSYSRGDRDVSARDALPANVYRLVAALEARVVDVAPDMTPQAVANALWGFATARWELGEESWQALQARTARCGGERDEAGGGGNGKTRSTREERNAFNAQETANVVWAVAKLGWSPESATWVGLNASVARTARDMDARAVALTLWAYATLGERPRRDALDALEARLEHLCDGSLLRTGAARRDGRAPSPDRPSLSARDVSNIWWAFVTLELAPGDAARRALERASVRVLTESRDVTPADVANQSWALAALEHLESGDDAEGDAELSRETSAYRDARANRNRSAAMNEWCRAIETAEVRLLSNANASESSSPRMSPSDVSCAMLNVAANSARRARLRRREASAEEAWRALERAAARFCADADSVTPQDLANVWYAFASVGRLPAPETRTALERAGAAAAPRFSARHVAAAAYAYAKVGFPDDGLDGLDAAATSAAFLRALDAAAARVAASDEMNAQSLAQTLWGFGAVAALSPSAAPERPMACSAALWRAARALDVRSTLDVTLCTFFHAKLMYEELVGARRSDAVTMDGVTTDGAGAASDDLDGDHLATIAFPSWIDAAAKEAWIKNAVGDVDVSGTHLLVAECLRSVLPTLEVVLECLTADECFSLDVYVPALDLGVEVDGPTHYAEAESSARRRRDAKTRLRDAFLRRRTKTLVVVPWFEFEEARSVEGRNAYIRAKLRDAGVEA
jgi:hypothetical protein